MWTERHFELVMQAMKRINPDIQVEMAEVGIRIDL